MEKVLYDLRGLTVREFADMFRISVSTIYTWQKENRMPYWASVVPIGPNLEADERDKEIARLNIVIDELLKRLAR